MLNNIKKLIAYRIFINEEIVSEGVCGMGLQANGKLPSDSSIVAMLVRAAIDRGQIKVDRTHFASVELMWADDPRTEEAFRGIMETAAEVMPEVLEYYQAGRKVDESKQEPQVTTGLADLSNEDFMKACKITIPED